MRWLAGVGEDDFLGRHARLYVAQERPDGMMNMLLEDGTMQTAEAGVHVERAGIRLPYAALEAIFDALQKWQGLQTHQATEAKVLREWLAAERDRVTVLMARQFDGGVTSPAVTIAGRTVATTCSKPTARMAPMGRCCHRTTHSTEEPYEGCCHSHSAEEESVPWPDEADQSDGYETS